MAKKLELYYFSGSYYSQKVFLALLEKQLPFTEHQVVIGPVGEQNEDWFHCTHSVDWFYPYPYLVFLALLEKQLPFTEHQVVIGPVGEQNEDWFLRLNPAGLVPVIKDGDDVICDSVAIIDYLDKKSATGPMLVPDADTSLGQRMSRMRTLLYEVPIEEVSYGLILNPCLRPKSTTPFLGAMEKYVTKHGYEKHIREELASFRARQKADPSLHEAMEIKMARYQWKLDNVFEEEHVRNMLHTVQGTFDSVESELEQSQRESDKEDVFLCGTTFTAADISMAVLFNRLTSLGADGEYYSATKRPRTFAYCQRLFSRPAVKRLLAETTPSALAPRVRRALLKKAGRKAGKMALVVGLVAVLAYGVKKYMDTVN